MKRFVAVVVGAAAFMAGNAEAQSDNNWIKVQANVQGIFDFQVDGNDYTTAASAPVYNFGAVDAAGINGAPTSVNTALGTATYRAEPAFTWTVVSAPKRTVDISYQNASVVGPPVVGSTGPMALTQMSIEMSITQQAGGTPGTSQGWTALSNAKTLLVNDVQAGNGSNTAAGDINVELTIDSDDAAGTNTFTVELLAEAV